MTLPRSALLVGILGVGPLRRTAEGQRPVKIAKVDGFVLTANRLAGRVRAGGETTQ